MAAIHNSPYAGSWYPGRREELAEMTAGLFAASRERIGDQLLPHGLGFVVPHAGLRYSGTVACAAWRHIRERGPKRVVLLAFAHHGSPPAVVMPDVDCIAVPTGRVSLSTAGLPFEQVAEGDVCDHSLEIQLPLLLEAVPDAAVVPLYVGQLDAAERRRSARILVRLLDGDTVLVASSDFTHFGRTFHFQPFPVDEDTPARIRELDEGAMEAAASLDAALFLDELRESGATVCGYNPISLLLDTLSQVDGGDFYQQTLDYQTSGELTGGYDHSVSYAALGYFPRQAFELTYEERELLRESARRTLDHLLATGQRKPVPPRSLTPNLVRRAGVFVSLHEAGELRGCIGHRVGQQPLADAVPELTLSAALDDPRFEPLRAANHPVEIEISVLTPLRRIRDASAFHLRRHGVFFSLQSHRSLLLPQVAEDRQWSVEEFLGALSRKAGLGTQAWRNPKARLYVFEAQVF